LNNKAGEGEREMTFELLLNDMTVPLQRKGRTAPLQRRGTHGLTCIFSSFPSLPVHICDLFP